MPTSPPKFRPAYWSPPVKRVKANYKTAAWQAARSACLERDNYRCTWVENGSRCSNRANTAHHLIEVADGGSDDVANLVSLCVNCHNKSHPSKGGRRG